MNMPTVVALIVSTLTAWLVARWLTRVAGDYGLRRNIVSHVTERSSHTKPTSRLGGVGLAGGFAAGAVLYLLAAQRLSLPIPRVPYPWFIGGWAVMFGVGLLDDLFDLKPVLKLALLVLGCALPCLGLALGPEAPRDLQSQWWIGLGFFWILFFVNGFNFMDGMDGFAGNFARSSGIFIFLVSLVLVLHHNLETINPFAIILAASATGFLRYNAPPARYFMGDGGSLSTGYLLAVFVLSRPLFGYGIIILMPFIFDVVLTIFLRARRGENLLKAHRSHLYQRLMQTGLSHARVLHINLWLFIVCGLLAVGVSFFHQDREIQFPLYVILIEMLIMQYYLDFTTRRELATATNPPNSET